MQALPHFCSTMIHLHGSITIDQHQRTRLVEKRCGERDAELHRGNREPALRVHASRVRSGDLLAPLFKLTRRLEACPDRRDPVGVLHLFTVVRSITWTIEVSLSNEVGGQLKALRRL